MGIGNQDETAFCFEGNWKSFARIALGNLFLTIVTLGFYRFWGITRERKYLWSQTRFIDDRLEWQGTGFELFLGFVMAVVILFLPVIGLQFLAQALVLQGKVGAAGAVFLLFYFAILFVTGLAIFRGLRYRLSRTFWHGIRGGSDDQGFGYAVSSMWKPIVGMMALGLMVPWSMTSLWAERWNKMSFGPHRFESGPEWSSLMGRYLLIYLVPVAAIVLAVILGVAGAGGASRATMGGAVALVIGAIYIGIPLVMLAFYAKFFRTMIGSLSLSTLDFHFTARTSAWFLLFLGNVAMVIGLFLLALIPAAALGLTSALQGGAEALAENRGLIIVTAALMLIPFGMISALIRYRSWSFFIRHLEATGEVDLADLTQSQTRAPRQGEGLLDTLDVGAI